MRKAITIAVLAVSVCVLGGCDFFRVLAGRPTSREIEAKRKTILALDTDSLAQQQPSAEPALTVLENLPATEPATEPKTEPETAPKVEPKTPSVTQPKAKATLHARSPELFAGSRPEYRYYVMIGTFGSRDNAVRQAAKAEKAGYETALLPFKTGLTAVGVCPTNDLDAANASFEKLRSEAFFPKDAWILNIE